MANKITPLSSEEQLKLRNRAKAELARLNAVSQNEDTKQVIDEFKWKFSISEYETDAERFSI